MGLERHALAVAAVLLLTLGSAPAFTQTEEELDNIPFDRDCMDDYGRNLCDVADWSGIVATFGIETADVAWTGGWRGVRVFTINGYSNDMPMIAVRDDGALEVRGADRDRADAHSPAILTRNAPPGAAAAVPALKALVAAAPERPSAENADGDNKEGGVISLCLHAWVTVTEVLGHDGVTRRIRNACGDNPLFNAAFEMSTLALNAIEHCKRLDPDRFRNDSTRLMGCLSLKGSDLFAAADVSNLFSEIDEIADFASYLTADARVTLPGGSTREALTAAPFDDFDFFLSDFDGAPGQVTVTGGLYRLTDDSGSESADMQQVWRLQDGGWRLTALTIGSVTPDQ